ncbi:hypothetical protein [Xanthomonas fragariae]|uniref:hypothetical protein n=1 Tax=Xanthomonas fragariae TaxID=48664 RepID=UPI0022AA5776|nr:hypothetical protein [Xanthomonas fragariae]WAT14269.1 hypothetical protein OZ429_14645 [Xanthomonas fragariae]
MKLAVSNTGGAPADGLTLEVRVEGTMMLVNHNVKEKWYPSDVRFIPPAPPKLERYSGSEWYMRQSLPDLSGLHRHFQTHPSPRDPQGFYWDYDEDAIFCKSAEGSCGDFRHQMREVEVPIILCLPQGEIEPKGCLHIRWSARNMPKVVEKKYSIKLSIDWYDSEDAVRRLVIGGET